MKCVKFKTIKGEYKMITKREFFKQVKRWQTINEINRCTKAIENEEVE